MRAEVKKMAGAACKVIINNMTRSLSEGMEETLTMPAVREKIGPDVADVLLTRLVAIDLAAITGTSCDDDSLLAILKELVGMGIVTDEVWTFLREPEE